MTEEWIERGDNRWKIVYGYGRLEIARALYITLLPDQVKKAIEGNPDITDEEVSKLLTLGERTDYSTELGRRINALVIESGPGWTRAKSPPENYVDAELPADVGAEIVQRMRAAISGASLTDDDKKK